MADIFVSYFLEQMFFCFVSTSELILLFDLKTTALIHTDLRQFCSFWLLSTGDASHRIGGILNNPALGKNP